MSSCLSGLNTPASCLPCLLTSVSCLPLLFRTEGPSAGSQQPRQVSESAAREAEASATTEETIVDPSFRWKFRNHTSTNMKLCIVEKRQLAVTEQRTDPQVGEMTLRSGNGLNPDHCFTVPANGSLEFFSKTKKVYLRGGPVHWAFSSRKQYFELIYENFPVLHSACQLEFHEISITADMCDLSVNKYLTDVLPGSNEMERTREEATQVPLRFYWMPDCAPDPGSVRSLDEDPDLPSTSGEAEPLFNDNDLYNLLEEEQLGLPERSCPVQTIVLTLLFTLLLGSIDSRSPRDSWTPPTTQRTSPTTQATRGIILLLPVLTSSDGLRKCVHCMKDIMQRESASTRMLVVRDWEEACSYFRWLRPRAPLSDTEERFRRYPQVGIFLYQHNPHPTQSMWTQDFLTDEAANLLVRHYKESFDESLLSFANVSNANARLAREAMRVVRNSIQLMVDNAHNALTNRHYPFVFRNYTNAQLRFAVSEDEAELRAERYRPPVVGGEMTFTPQDAHAKVPVIVTLPQRVDYRTPSERVIHMESRVIFVRGGPQYWCPVERHECYELVFFNRQVHFICNNGQEHEGEVPVIKVKPEDIGKETNHYFREVYADGKEVPVHTVARAGL